MDRGLCLRMTLLEIDVQMRMTLMYKDLDIRPGKEKVVNITGCNLGD